MSRPVNIISEPDFSQYNDVIDVRSPAEFADDHAPGAINLYVLDDDERAEVGTIYKQESPFKGRKLGASLVSANIARWTREYFLDKPQDYKPLVYCWRGGQRSMSLATILSRIGWETSLLDGGYKGYRKQVIRTIEDVCKDLQVLVLSGLTGTAKTDMLKLFQQKGGQMIDLEGLANHRGSMLGFDPENPQPSQKYFESLLVKELLKLSPEKPVLVESESNKIGNVHCPAPLWEKMTAAKLIQVTASMQERVNYLLNEYQFFTENPQELKDKVTILKFRHGKEQINSWLEQIDQKDWKNFVGSLLEQHYDPAYVTSCNRNQRSVLKTLELENLSTSGLEKGSEEILGLINCGA